MPKIGVLFDIDELDSGLYGYAAYKVLFAALDSRQIAGCALSDGDTSATLSGQANQYCIAIEAPDDSTIAIAKNALSKVDAKGLLPLPSRFMGDALANREPLVQAAYVGSAGELIHCQTGWVMAAWKESQGKGD